VYRGADSNREAFDCGVKRALGLHIPHRSLVILPDDIFLVSFPKSGNTWTRFLLANLRFPGEPVNWANIDRLVPDPMAPPNAISTDAGPASSRAMSVSIRAIRALSISFATRAMSWFRNITIIGN